MAASALAALVVGAGCLTPVAAVHDRAYVGLYSVEARRLSDTVEYERVAGFGLSVGRSGFGIGYSDLRAVTAEMDAEGCEVATPLCLLATGKAAEDAAPAFCRELVRTGGRP